MLPLSYSNGWFSGDWFLRKEHCFLVPGDSPTGYRLPLDSLPWALPRDRGDVIAADTYAPLPPLPGEFTVPALTSQRGDARRTAPLAQAQ